MKTQKRKSSRPPRPPRERRPAQDDGLSSSDSESISGADPDDDEEEEDSIGMPSRDQSNRPGASEERQRDGQAEKGAENIFGDDSNVSVIAPDDESSARGHVGGSADISSQRVAQHQDDQPPPFGDDYIDNAPLQHKSPAAAAVVVVVAVISEEREPAMEEADTAAAHGPPQGDEAHAQSDIDTALAVKNELAWSKIKSLSSKRAAQVCDAIMYLCMYAL